MGMLLFQATMMNMEKPPAKSAVTPEQLLCYPPVSRDANCIQKHVTKKILLMKADLPRFRGKQ